MHVKIPAPVVGTCNLEYHEKVKYHSMAQNRQVINQSNGGADETKWKSATCPPYLLHLLSNSDVHIILC